MFCCQLLVLVGACQLLIELLLFAFILRISSGKNLSRKVRAGDCDYHGVRSRRWTSRWDEC